MVVFVCGVFMLMLMQLAGIVFKFGVDYDYWDSLVGRVIIVAAAAALPIIPLAWGLAFMVPVLSHAS